VTSNQERRTTQQEIPLSSSARVLTLGEICRRLPQYPQHRVEYILKTRNVKPACRAGNLRIYAEHDLAFIASELRRIDEERGRIE